MSKIDKSKLTEENKAKLISTYHKLLRGIKEVKQQLEIQQRLQDTNRKGEKYMNTKNEYPNHVIELMRKELEEDGVFKNKFCKVWFNEDKKVIYGEELVGCKRKLQTSGKDNIYKSWHDVVIEFNPDTTIDKIREITSQYGFTIIE